MTTFINLKKNTARELKLLNVSTDAIMTGKDITEAMMGNALNDAYLEDTFSMVAAKFPFFYERSATAPNYSATGTVSASSTGTTLVAGSAIFTNSMVGLTVYNSTDSTSAVIESYTNTTTVTLESTIGDTWDGDTIYVLDNTIGFGGDAVDLSQLRWVTVRYAPANNRIKATLRDRTDLIQTNEEVFSSVNPQYYPTTISVSSSPVSAIRMLPKFTTINDSQAIEIGYIEKPPVMSGDTDTPRLPLGHHEFLKWRAVEVLAAGTRRDFELAKYAAGQYELGKQNLVRHFQSGLYDEPVLIRPSRRLKSFMTRRI